ncbi:hypothetical protein BDF21DRAFT_396877 [Thamnidium elegans]|nr:hypothetical protein BDF21DRAFT_396877 [Thamnidium elegans]
MLAISAIDLFQDSSFLSLLSSSTTSVLLACPGPYFWDAKIYCAFVPTVASHHAWRKICKPLSPRDLLKEALPPGICLLAEEPKGLMVTPLPVCPLPSCPPLSPSSPPSPLPPVYNTGWKPIKSFTSTAKELSKEHQSGFFYPDNEMMLFITSLTIVYIIGNRMARY